MRHHDLRAIHPTPSPTLSLVRLAVHTPDSPSLDVRVSTEGGTHVVTVTGELDVQTRGVVEQACLAGDDQAVVVEMGDLTFMDCCGYAGIVAARRALQAHGGSLTLTHQAGQPARLLALLGAAERVRDVTPSVVASS